MLPIADRCWRSLTVLCALSIYLLLSACVSVDETPTAKRMSPEEVSAELFARAKTFYLAEDYVMAASLMQPLAKHGHLQAQYVLGYMYFNGQGLPRNEREAIRWLSVAAARGDAKAKAALAAIELGGTESGDSIK